VCRFFFLILIIPFCGAKLRAQYNPADTFRIYLKKKPSLYFSMDGRNSFVRDRPAIIDGARIGLSYGGKIRLLAGIYDLRFPIYRVYKYKAGTPEEEWRTQRSDFTYVSFTCDYVVYNQKKWKLSIPVQTGIGWGSRKEWSQQGENRMDKGFAFIPLDISLSANYRIFPWLYAGGGLGYRYALFSTTISSDFSAPIYTYGIGIDIAYLYAEYLKKSLK
jgi:hypothetical protein